MKIITALGLGLAAVSLAACQTNTTTPMAASSGGATAGQLILAQFKANKWDVDWRDENQRRHKCGEAVWFYTGMANVRSVAELDAFWDGENPGGLDMNQDGSSTYKAVRAALERQPIPEDLNHKAKCIIDPPRG